MTINLSSKGGSEGTGSATKNPRVLPVAFTGYLYMKYHTSTYYYDAENDFWTQFAKVGLQTTYSTNDTWQTAVNITNSYGSVYNLIGPLHHYSIGTGVHQFRITVDGTEYLIEPPGGTDKRNKRLVVGNVLPFRPINTDIDDLPNQVGSYDDNGLNQYPTTIVHPIGISSGYMPDPLTASMQGSPYLYFTDSFKFEVKISYMGTSARDSRIGCVCSYLPNF